jgi:hypothetical protein
MAQKVLGVTPKPAKHSIDRLIEAGILGEKSRKIVATNYYLAHELIALTNAPLDDAPLVRG